MNVNNRITMHRNARWILYFVVLMFYSLLSFERQYKLMNPFLSQLASSHSIKPRSLVSSVFTTSDTLHDSDASKPMPALPGDYVHPNIMYGHLHMAKTGGTSLNGILANQFERICGHKGYSYDSYEQNEIAKATYHSPNAMRKYGRDRVDFGEMEKIGYENCNYVSHEIKWKFWISHFGNRTFHGIPMELHVPCRDRVDHLMSQCNHNNRQLDCEASSDQKFYKSIDKCFVMLDRIHKDLTEHFDIKCYDFKNQFTTYLQYMSEKLQPRMLVSSPYVKRETNLPRNRTKECIWKYPKLLEKTDKYLLKNIYYYQFCESCMGSENEIAG
jgi:hypothetical protein